MKIKRIIAYLLDLFLVTYIATMLFTLIPAYKHDNEEYNKYTDELTKEITNIKNVKDIESMDPDRITELEYQIYKSSTPLLIFKIGITILYFGVLGYILKGQTLFKKLFKIKVESQNGEPLKPHQYMLREIILTNVIPEAISLIILITSSKTIWYNATQIISFVENTILFTIALTMLFTKDALGLHDILLKTKVSKVVKEEKA